MAEYIVASSKPWHQKGFETVSTTLPGGWTYVESPDELSEELAKTNPRYVFFLHWNWRVPDETWSNYECVCFHMTDVPYGRGGSPLQNLILAGHQETRLSALRMVEEMDAGPVYTKRALSLAGTAEEIFMRAGELCFEIVEWMVQEEPQPMPQVGEPTVFRRRKPEESVLPRGGQLEDLYDYVRMLDAPTYPKSFIQYGDFVLEFSDAQLDTDSLKATVHIRKVSDSGDSYDRNH